jgi:hypothetical protein
MPNLPIQQFIQTRLLEFDPNFQVRVGSGFYDLFIKPMAFLLQPLADDAARLQIAQSLRRILLQDDPDAFDEESVDAILSNIYVTRVAGGKSGGLARVYYSKPVDREWPAGGANFTAANGTAFSNPAPFIVTFAQVSTQIENGNYYFDIPVASDTYGLTGNIDAGGLVSFDNDSEAISVTNTVKFTGGVDRETNKVLIERARQSIGERSLTTGKGITATFFDNFAASLKEIQPIGFGDPEMMRDVVYNAHIGGKVDAFFKGNEVLVGSQNFLGVLTDTTRQTYVTTNIQLFGTDEHSLRNVNIDRSNNRPPVVKQIAPETRAVYTVPLDLTGSMNLAQNASVQVGIDGQVLNIRIAGAIPSSTERTEVVAKINSAFGFQVAFFTATSFELRSQLRGTLASVSIGQSITGTSVSTQVLGLPAGPTVVIYGTGPTIYREDHDFTIDDEAGTIKRVIGAEVLPTQLAGITTEGSDIFTDSNPGVYFTVNAGHILTIVSGADAGDYRIVSKQDNTLVLDKKMTATSGSVSYYVTATAIKNGENIYAQYYYNPLSIDVGPLVKLDSAGFLRGVRTGREDYTLFDVAFLRIRKIEMIDPLTQTLTGTVLEGKGGYGRGGFGKGAYGIGSAADYRLVINSPEERFSAFEDAYIVLNPALIGLSFNVEYDYAPEVMAFHTFARSDRERVLTGDVLMRHFLPAYVSATIEYRVDPTDSSIEDNATLQLALGKFIEGQPAGSDLEISDVYQFLQSTTDPYNRYGTYVKPFEMTAVVHNTDGTKTIIRGTDKLAIPTLDPFPKFTKRPLSARITHWVAESITLVRLP